ncbi:hypothetical protein AURDEDRAFT_173505 [Auricularia subglabra TFB-10046 SS5]|nr:hypothetical protein AURDEDRAFT_173505 [Auricularia subglabra TFB-10046 SS5]
MLLVRSIARTPATSSARWSAQNATSTEKASLVWIDFHSLFFALGSLTAVPDTQRFAPSTAWSPAWDSISAADNMPATQRAGWGRIGVPHATFVYPSPPEHFVLRASAPRPGERYLCLCSVACGLSVPTVATLRHINHLRL